MSTRFANIQEPSGTGDGRVDLQWDGRGIASLIINRPRRRNCLTHEMSSTILSGLLAAEEDPAVRVVVLRGAGGGFCSGDDVGTVDRWRAGDRSDAPFDHVTSDAHYLRICEAIVSMPKPVVAVLEGAAAGAGAEIACAADYRFCSSGVRIGSCLVLVGHVGNMAMMSRVVGPARATEIYLTGRLVDAEEALAIGLVDRVVPDDSFDAELEAFLERLATAPTRSIGLFKELRERSWGQSAQHALRLQDAYHLRTHREVQDGAEGLRAFVERRPPRFTGQ
ncbi:MAG: enoyl-CoA hydratase-related protein [Actinomycetota bacterium]|nr:enoyl-CoA hydratase-related protein [Actinomycetota bacterium]